MNDKMKEYSMMADLNTFCISMIVSANVHVLTAILFCIDIAVLVFSGILRYTEYINNDILRIIVVGCAFFFIVILLARKYLTNEVDKRSYGEINAQLCMIYLLNKLETGTLKNKDLIISNNRLATKNMYMKTYHCMMKHPESFIKENNMEDDD